MATRSTRKANGGKAGKNTKAKASASTRGNGGVKNSRYKARTKQPYSPEPKPSNVKDVVDTINMWSCYFMFWAKRMDERVSKIEHHLEQHGVDVPGRPTTHLDPPPEEPYTPPPA